jgi:hypothetical protein
MGHRLFKCPELEGKEAMGAHSKKLSWWQGCSTDDLEQLATSIVRLEIDNVSDKGRRNSFDTSIDYSLEYYNTSSRSSSSEQAERES